MSFLSSLVPWSGYSIQIRRENNWKKHATLLPYTMNQIESEKHMRMTWEIHRNTMKYCTTDLQSEGRWHILRNASHAWSHLDYLNALKTFCICPKCINTSKRILKQQETQKKGCFLGCNSCSITELQGTQRYPKNLSYHLSMTFGDSMFTNNFWPHLPSIFKDFFHILRCLSLWPSWSSSQCFWGQVFQPLHQPAGWSWQVPEVMDQPWWDAG